MALLGIHFPVFGAARKLLEGDENYSDFSCINTLLSGGAAGVVGSLVSTPVELIRTKLQMQGNRCSATGTGPRYAGSVDCFRRVLSRHGLKGLYRGFSSTLLRDMQGYAWFFLGYEATVNCFLQRAGPGVHTKADLSCAQVMAAGVVAGFGLWGSMFPIDTIKSKMQADNLAAPQYRSTADCLRQVLRTEGNAGLWRGFGAATMRGVPVNAGVFLAVESARRGVMTCEQRDRLQASMATV